MLFRKYLAIFVFSLCFTGISGFEAQAKRVALVIGNDQYINVDPLLKAVNDAKAVAAVVKELGFHVIQRNNANRSQINDGLTELGGVIEPGDEILFFFAGHGISVKGHNYLLPTDIPAIKPGQEHSIKKESFSENEIITLLQEYGARVSILIIDACRNNPFPKQGTRSVGRNIGLDKHTSPPQNAFVMYSAGLGQQALDRLSEEDDNPNSVFTRKLLPLLKTPGLSHVQMAKRLQIEVEKLALTTAERHKQFPAFYDQVRGNFYLIPDGQEVALESLKQPILNQENILWQTVKGSTKISDYEFYLGKYPSGTYSSIAELKIKQLKDNQVSQTEVVQKLDLNQDEVLWQSLKNSDNASDFEFYLSKFPNGKFANVAELRIRKLKQQLAGLHSNTLRSPERGAVLNSCEKLWVARNQIWRRHKYCFTTSRAINYFSNTGCFRNVKQAQNVMSKKNRSRVKALLRQERALGCL